VITVYAETSFVLQHARRQDGSSTEEILRVAREKKISLVVPILSLFEPLYNWRGRKADHNEQLNKMRGLATELERGDRTLKAMQHEAATSLRETILKLAPLIENDRQAIAEAITAVEGCAQVLQIARGQFARAAKLEGQVTGPADALVLETILDHAGNRQGSERSDERFFLAIDKGFSEAPVEAQPKEAGVVTFRTTAALLGKLRSCGVL
jgi:hypothetical protein